MKYEEFISSVKRRARLTSTEEADRAVRATLETLAERLTGDEAEQLAAQLPDKVAMYMQPYAETSDDFSLDEFFSRVSEREKVSLVDANYHARVVTGLLTEVVTMGEIEDVRAQLPEDFAELFEVENEGEVPGLGRIEDEEEDV